MNGKLSYTGRDVVDIRRALVDKIPELTDKWTDYAESDLGMVIIELIAGSQDMQNYYFDAQTFETFLDTAVQPKNILSLLRVMNYRIPLIGSAKGVVRLEYKDTDVRSINVPRYYQFYCSKQNVYYVAKESVETATENGVVDIPVIEGEFREKRVTRQSLASNITSSGNVSRRIYLDSTMVADKSIEICQEGCVWVEVDDALLEYHGGYFYSVHRDSDGQVYLLMSVNFMDLMPVNLSEEVIIKYVVSKGTSGIVDANQIDTIIHPTRADIHATELKYIGNPTKTYGAYDDMNLNLAKILARRNMRNMGRYVTREDYASGVATEPYIKYYVVKDWKTREYVQEPFVIKIWAVDMQGNNIGDLDKKSLISKLESDGVTAVDVQIVDTEIIEFDINIQVVLSTSSVSDAQKVCNIIKEEIMNYYSIESLSYGSRVSLSILNSRIYTMSPYVKDVLVISPESDIETTEIQFPRLRNVTVEAVKRIE